ncbi:nuclease-related domain-containing protein [Neobacillus terrae]|uniref:nuclease-related domain-containing protein n=1 Tax=Neobacillus terrae TaxID=3034837 RepID=UPI00140CF5A7|nr:nuclease-related domain-containing protein [Neobacillus terrae]NHM31541.1 NERD domain-containing protein [Neobacillus terrae]
MFVKEASPSQLLLKLAALKDRLHDDNPKKVNVIKDWYKESAGYYGEKSLDYYLSFLDEKNYLIFHNLRLPSGKYFFQIDLLILTSFYGLVVESKNISGELYFDSKFCQLIKAEDGKEKRLGDPFSQVRHQSNQLTSFFAANNLPPLQIEYLVALTNQNAIIKNVTGNHGEQHKLCRGANILEKIGKIEKYIAHDRFTSKDIKKIAKILLKNHTSPDIDILKQFNISKEEIITGVRCPSCSFLPMQNTHGKWSCPSCSGIYKDAYEDAVKDYFLLFGPQITNKEFRWFTHLYKRNTATRYLSSMELGKSGSNRGSIYLPAKKS